MSPCNFISDYDDKEDNTQLTNGLRETNTVHGLILLSGASMHISWAPFSCCLPPSPGLRWHSQQQKPVAECLSQQRKHKNSGQSNAAAAATSSEGTAAAIDFHGSAAQLSSHGQPTPHGLLQVGIGNLGGL